MSHVALLASSDTDIKRWWCIRKIQGCRGGF